MVAIAALAPGSPSLSSRYCSSTSLLLPSKPELWNWSFSPRTPRSPHTGSACSWASPLQFPVQSSTFGRICLFQSWYLRSASLLCAGSGSLHSHRFSRSFCTDTTDSLKFRLHTFARVFSSHLGSVAQGPSSPIALILCAYFHFFWQFWSFTFSKSPLPIKPGSSGSPWSQSVSRNLSGADCYPWTYSGRVLRSLRKSQKQVGLVNFDSLLTRLLFLALLLNQISIFLPLQVRSKLSQGSQALEAFLEDRELRWRVLGPLQNLEKGLLCCLRFWILIAYSILTQAFSKLLTRLRLLFSRSEALILRPFSQR